MKYSHGAGHLVSSQAQDGEGLEQAGKAGPCFHAGPSSYLIWQGYSLPLTVSIRKRSQRIILPLPRFQVKVTQAQSTAEGHGGPLEESHNATISRTALKNLHTVLILKIPPRVLQSILTHSKHSHFTFHLCMHPLKNTFFKVLTNKETKGGPLPPSCLGVSCIFILFGQSLKWNSSIFSVNLVTINLKMT